MSETTLIDAPNTVIKFNVSEAEIKERTDRYMLLTIDGTDDKVGIAAVGAGRKELKKMRGIIKKAHKELKAPALERGRLIDKLSNHLTSMIQPTEDHLIAEENKVKDELQRIARAKLEAYEQKMIARLDAFDNIGLRLVRTDVEGMSSQEFESALIEETKAHDEMMESDRIANEERELLQAEEDDRRRIAQEKLDAGRAELNRQKAEAAAEREKLEAQQREINAEREKVSAAEKEKQDKLDAVEKIIARIEAEDAEKSRLKAILPDQEKIRGVVAALDDIEVPEISSDKTRNKVCDAIACCIADVVAAIEEM